MGTPKEVLLIPTDVPGIDLSPETTNTFNIPEQTSSMSKDLTTSQSPLEHLDLDARTTPYGLSMLAPELAFYPKSPRQRQNTKNPPPKAPPTLMPRNRRIQQDTTTGFFRLPREIREAIYIFVVDPYCGLPQLPRAFDSVRKCGRECNHKNATKLMVLCSQVWEEAIETVHLVENMLLVAGGKGPIFRHPKDFGKPGFFQSTVPSTRLKLPPILSEGQILRMRRVAIQIKYLRIGWEDRTDDIQRMHVEISTIVNALEKSRCLEEVRLILGDRCLEYSDHDFLNTEHPYMRRLLKPLIDMAHERGIKIGAEQACLGAYEYSEGTISYPPGADWGISEGSKTWKEFEDPLVTWFNNAAIPREIKANFTTRYLEETKEMQKDSLNLCKNSAMPYELTPECRCCLQVFGGWEQLAMHLEKQPKHKVLFRYKRWNKLYHLAGRIADRKCPTCANGYHLLVRYENHMNEFWHYRPTIIPRYVCDNYAYVRRAEEQAKRKAGKY